MNAIDIFEQAQSGKPVIPQYETNGATYLKSRQGDREIYLTKPDGSGYRLIGGNNGYVGKDSIGGANALWDYATDLDLPDNRDKKTQNMTMLYNAIEALKNRQFNEKMYGERYQKIIADIKKAGLNPYAINFFSPGGVQSGSAASIMSNYQASNSQVRSSSKIKSTAKNENKNTNEIGDFSGFMQFMSILGMVASSFFRALAH